MTRSKRRFQARAADPKRRWKLSPIDIASRGRWVDYSRAKDAMFEYTDTKDCPWYVVNAHEKKRARLNCINHILERVPYEDVLPPPIELPPRADRGGYIRPPLESQTSFRDASERGLCAFGATQAHNRPARCRHRDPIRSFPRIPAGGSRMAPCFAGAMISVL